jgi:Tfp pilus assembly protein PilO
VKRQLPIAAVLVPALLIVAAVAYFVVLKPKQDEAGRLDEEIAQLKTEIDATMAARQAPKAPDVKIRVADLFRLTKAMPDEHDMPGIILELNTVASAAGIEFVSISPLDPVPATGFSRVPINLTFEGNFYDLTDFLFRLRNLVIVQDGELAAEGRLFALESIVIQEGRDKFPEVQAALTVSAYVYTPDATEAAAAATATPTTTPTTTEPSTEGAALGGTG